MKTLGIIGSVLAVLLLAITPAAATETTQAASGVATSSGTLDLPAGIAFGGVYTNSIILTAATVFQTASGPVTAEPGTEVDCDPVPGDPDPCDLGI